MKSLSELDRALVEGASVAYANAKQLLDWWKPKLAAKGFKHFNVPLPRDPSIQVECFFDTLTFSGKPATAMGCSWRSRFRPAGSPSPEDLRRFIQDEFPSRCLGKRPNGAPGGFAFLARPFKKFGAEEYGTLERMPSLREIGTTYDWLVVEAVVHDFFLNTPGPAMPGSLLRRMPRMASYVLVHPDYFQSFFPPVPGALAEVSFGYSFLPMEVAKSVFGYGPGKFRAAVKQFRWILHPNSEIEIELMFLVSNRSEKILSLGGFDPVYGLIHLLDSLGFRAFGFAQKMHDRLDAMQLAVHARVYQSLVEGMRAFWEQKDWTARKL